MTTRRNFLRFLGTLPVGAYGLQSAASAEGGENLLSQIIPEAHAGSLLGVDEMDEALKLLAPYGASFRGGLSNHGPMTAEAMVALGHQDAVIPWIERYRRRLEARPSKIKKIDGAKWKEALGHRSRIRDWQEYFAKELAESPWPKVLATWLPRLAPGMAAAGLHGVIRTGHAVCSLTIKNNKLRLDELARSLGYWAAEYIALSGKYTGKGKLAPSLALKDVVQMPWEQRSSGGLIASEMKQLLGFEPFAKVIDLVDVTQGAPNFMADLLATFAGIYINSKSGSFQFLHAITGAAAIAELLPHTLVKDRAAVMAHTWQVTAGIFARYGQKDLVAELKAGSKKEKAKKLAKLAVVGGNEHSIKLVCACHREWLRNPDSRLMVAATVRMI